MLDIKVKLIYIADDELNIRNLIKSFLENDGYVVESFENGDLLFEAFSKKQPDLVILDIMMPGSDGFVICSKIRKASNIPVIMLTARDGESDYITGITLGSDDYFTKPFSPLKLMMKVRAIFRRIEMEKEQIRTNQISIGNIKLLTEQREVVIKEKYISLTVKELDLLSFLIECYPRAIHREELLNKIWGYESVVESRVTDDTVKRLRKKITEAGSNVKIETVWGFGFKLSIEENR